jgi:hypothetical protein
MGRVEGRVAFITGAARGQGRSHAVRLAQDGADVIAVDSCEQIETAPYPLATPDDLSETIKQVENLARRIVSKQADVRDLAALESGNEYFPTRPLGPAGMNPRRDITFKAPDGQGKQRPARTIRGRQRKIATNTQVNARMAVDCKSVIS